MDKYYWNIPNIGIHFTTINSGQTFEGKNNGRKTTDTLAADTGTENDFGEVQAVTSGDGTAFQGV